jgi:soluble lytic murein transglycosylase
MQFFRHAAETLPAGPRAALAQMAIDLGRPHIGVRMAKDAAAAGMILPNQYYPVHDLAEGDWPVPTELAMAIARQESEFNHRAVSPAGAKGLMQLMPRTAEQVARNHRHRLRRTCADRGPGVQRPARHRLSAADARPLPRLAHPDRGRLQCRPRPGRPVAPDLRRPARPAVDAITWIESIPFEETRNYVMRVLEGLHVYRARLNGQAEPIRLVSDINRTG